MKTETDKMGPIRSALFVPGNRPDRVDKAVATAAGIAPPLDTPFMIGLKDIDALKDDTRRAKQMGFEGKLCIHPNQIEPCHAIFPPAAEEIEFARRVVDAFETREIMGLAAIQVDEKFVNYPLWSDPEEFCGSLPESPVCESKVSYE
jgi:citrate lyase beta subunit